MNSKETKKQSKTQDTLPAKDEHKALMKEVTRSRTIKAETRYMLWGRSGGRCQFKGCNTPLWKNGVNQELVNIAQAAHIYAFSPIGPRGKKNLCASKINHYSNLLLVCHKCHKTIDSTQDGGRYSIELLRKWKEEHESRIERVTEIDPNHKSHVVLYDRAIGGIDSPVNYEQAAEAMFPKRYPVADKPFDLSNSGSVSTEKEDTFWKTEVKNLERKFSQKISPIFEEKGVTHLSIFALAPMPLLIKLGTLITELREAAVYQLHRHPRGWKWPSEEKKIEFQIVRPEIITGVPVLVIALSAIIEDSRVYKVLGDNVTIWKIKIPEPCQECIRSVEDLHEFSKVARRLLNKIQAAHGSNAELSIFPAAPVSTMVELGRVRQSKAAMNWAIYDENRELGGFTKTIEINTESQNN